MSGLNLCKEGIIGKLPLLLLFDFAAAFPSVRHAWLVFIIMQIGMPRGLQKAIKRMYADNEAFYECGGDIYWLFCVVSGVLQGCPLSGSLFVICMDPLLHFFKPHIEDRGLCIVRACSDDVGATLGALHVLPIFQNGLDKFKRLFSL